MSVYGWEIDPKTGRAVHADRVVSRETFVVERGVDPIRLDWTTGSAAPLPTSAIAVAKAQEELAQARAAVPDDEDWMY